MGEYCSHCVDHSSNPAFPVEVLAGMESGSSLGIGAAIAVFLLLVLIALPVL
jgi:hypothetical protein